jgi:N-sulfoglucosamine sulfohydrolase
MKDLKSSVLIALLAAASPGLAQTEQSKPNILWISCEDASPWFGFNGDTYAKSPNLDTLAKKSVNYSQAFATAPICSPSRFAIITGRYATSHGTQRLRSKFPIPDDLTSFPAYLRKAGYFCTNKIKTDYNTSAEERLIAEGWDEFKDNPSWRKRAPGQPFFSVINLEQSHQGQVFKKKPPELSPEEYHDPAQAPVPPYYPDNDLSRQTMARAYDVNTAMDKAVGRVLEELKKDGLLDDTIIFFWSDHGQGIPRGKRTLWDTGLQVPLLVHMPEKFRHLAPGEPGTSTNRLVSLVDLGPTMLSIVGLQIPEAMQGSAFLGPAAGKPREYVFGARDRADEANEVSRSVRDGRFLYIRNFMPHLSWNQPEFYSDGLELRREISTLAREGKLNEAQMTYAGPTKPAEALYDSQSDPWQIHNLANDPKYAGELDRMRRELRKWQTETRDIGMLHETEATRGMDTVNLDRVLDTAWLVGMPGTREELLRRLNDPEPGSRYWAVVGLHGESEVPAEPLRQLLKDQSPSVRTEAAGLLIERHGDIDAIAAMKEALDPADRSTYLHAARTLQLLREKAAPLKDAMKEALTKTDGVKDEYLVNYARSSLRNAIGFLNQLEKQKGLP